MKGQRKKSKLYYSNRSHALLEGKHNQVANDTKSSWKSNFMAIVKRDYHDTVREKQSKEKRILPKKEKTKIFNKRYRDLARYNNWVNYHSPGSPRYVPKKYKHLEASDASRYDSYRV